MLENLSTKVIFGRDTEESRKDFCTGTHATGQSTEERIAARAAVRLTKEERRDGKDGSRG